LQRKTVVDSYLSIYSTLFREKPRGPGFSLKRDEITASTSATETGFAAVCRLGQRIFEHISPSFTRLPEGSSSAYLKENNFHP